MAEKIDADDRQTIYYYTHISVSRGENKSKGREQVYQCITKISKNKRGLESVYQKNTVPGRIVPKQKLEAYPSKNTELKKIRLWAARQKGQVICKFRLGQSFVNMQCYKTIEKT